MSFKEMFLSGFKPQWKALLQKSFETDPERLKTANMKEVAQEMFGHSAVKGALMMVSVTVEDLEKVLTECRDELIREAKE